MDNRRQLIKTINKHVDPDQRIDEVLGDIAGFFGNILNPGGIFTGIGSGVDEAKVKAAGSPAAWILFKAMAGPGTDEAAIQKVFASTGGDPRKIAQLSNDYDRLIQTLIAERSGIGSALKKVGLGALRGTVLGAATGYAGTSLVQKKVNSEFNKFKEEATQSLMNNIQSGALDQRSAAILTAVIPGIQKAAKKGNIDLNKWVDNFLSLDPETQEAMIKEYGDGSASADEIKTAVSGLGKARDAGVDITKLIATGEGATKVAAFVGVDEFMDSPQAKPYADVVRKVGMDPNKMGKYMLTTDPKKAAMDFMKDGALIGALFGGLDIAASWLTNYLYDDDLATWLEDDGMDQYANLVRSAISQVQGGRLNAGKIHVKKSVLKSIIVEELVSSKIKENQDQLSESLDPKTIVTTKSALKKILEEQYRASKGKV